MRKIILLSGVSLALAACNSGGGDAPAPAGTETTAAAEAAPAAVELAAMPTEALSGEAAVAKQKERHEWFEELGDQFKILMRQSKSGSPDMAEVQKASAVVVTKSNDLPGLFAPGTGPDAGKTEAKANIWEKQDDFMARARDFQSAAVALNTAAQSGDAAAFKDAFGKAGGTCKACHDTYREKD